MSARTFKEDTCTRGPEVSRSESEERRALVLPQELKAMGAVRQVVLCEELPHPVLCDKIRYYRERHFTTRLLAKTVVPKPAIG
jgi:type IV secretion system protein VirD4